MKKSYFFISFFAVILLGISIVSAQATIFSIKKWPLSLQTTSGGRTAIFSGELDTAQYSEEQRKQFKLSLYYVEADVEAGTTPFTSAVYDSVAAYNQDPDRPEGKRDYRYVQASKIDPTAMLVMGEILVIPQESLGVDEKTGKYTFVIKNLSPGTTYYYAQVAELDGKVEVRAHQFDSSKGYMTASEKEDDFEKRSYRLLSPFPGLAVLLDPDLCLQLLNENKPVPSLCTREDPSGFSTFINYMFRLLIGLSAALLVLRMIFEGYQYVVSDVPFLKANAKSKLFEAFFGLLLALAAYLILNTINPKLVSNKIEIRQIDVAIEEAGTDLPAEQISGSYLRGSLSANTKEKLGKMPFPAGVFCPGKTGGSGDIRKVATSFINKVTYNNTSQRGSAGPSGTIYLDCSLYVNTVLACAGITPKTADYTGDMLAKGERITGAVEVRNGVGYVNGKALKPGDLLGTFTGKGHVWIYIGNGEILDSQTNGRNPGRSVVTPLDALAKKVKNYGKLPELNFVYRI